MARIVSGLDDQRDAGFAWLAGTQLGHQKTQESYETAQRQAALMMEFQKAIRETAAEDEKRRQKDVDRDALGLAQQMRSRAIAGKFAPIMQQREGRARVYQRGLAAAQAKGASPEAMDQLVRLIDDIEQAARFEEGEHFKRQTIQRLQESQAIQPEQAAMLSQSASPGDVLKLDVDIEERQRGENTTAARSARELEGAKMRLQAERDQAARRGEPPNPYTDALEGTIMTFEGNQDLWKDEDHLNRFIQDTRWLQEQAMKPGGGGTDPSLVRQREVNTALKLLEAEFGDPKYIFMWPEDQQKRYSEKLAEINAFAQGGQIVGQGGEVLRQTGQGGIPNLAESAVQPQGKFTPLGQGLAEIGPILQRAQQGVAAGFQSGMSVTDVINSVAKDLNLDLNDPRVQSMIETQIKQYGSGAQKPAKTARKR